MKKNRIRAIILFALTLVLLFFFFRSVEWNEVLGYLDDIDLKFFILLMFMAPLNFVFRAIRWRCLLKHEKEMALMKLLLGFPKAAADAARDYKPHYLASFAHSLASAFNDFYEACRVLQAETPQLKAARLALCKAAQNVLESALGLLGIEAPDRM